MLDNKLIEARQKKAQGYTLATLWLAIAQVTWNLTKKAVIALAVGVGFLLYLVLRMMFGALMGGDK